VTGPIDAVIFDWGGTITPWHTVDLREQWTVFARGMGAIACSLNDTASAVHAAEEAAWQRGRSEGTSARLDEILQDGRARPGGARRRKPGSRHTGTSGSRTPSPTQPSPHSGSRCGTRGIRVGVLSNTIWTRDYHREIFARDEVLQLIDGDIYSSETPWVKPRTEIFLAAAAAVEADPRRCVYVGRPVLRGRPRPAVGWHARHLDPALGHPDRAAGLARGDP
jgi:putative hydrolase of the HAD superfamily